jgi:hypothetical protein
VTKCSKESLDVLKAMEPVIVGAADQKELAGGQSSNTSLANVITPVGSHVATIQPLIRTPSTVVGTSKTDDVVAQERHG